MFTQKVDLDLSKSMELLRQAGIQFENETQTIDDIAKRNNIIPKQVYDIIRTAVLKKETAGHPVFPDFPPPGFGKRKLAEICTEFGLDLENIVHVLSRKRIKAEPAQSLKEIASQNNTEPMNLFEIIRDTINAS